MSYFFDQYYKCGDRKFLNIFQAFRYQKQTGHFPEFRIDKELINKMVNHKKPKDTSGSRIQQLLVNRLKQIRNQYSKVKLLYSGGTDSYTILKLCMDNDIFIDETITHMISVEKNVRTNLEYIAGIKLLQKYIGTKVGKSTVIHPTLKDLDFVNDPDWFYDEKIVVGPFLTFRTMSMRKMTDQALKDEQNTVVLSGYEKPEFSVEDGKIFWGLYDYSVGEMMGSPNNIPLFLDKHNPELVVSMAYAALEQIKKFNITPKNKQLKFVTKDPEIRKQYLLSIGQYPTPYNFVNMHLLGKTEYNNNRKTARFFKELEKHNRADYLEKMFDTHKKIKQLYGELPYAIESQGNLVKSVSRQCQRIEILPDSFGSVYKN